MSSRVLFLAGPTGAGKSDAALFLAPRLNAEIISADSMQVYRGMDIGTAKPTKEEQRLVRHHLIDLRDPAELFSVYDFDQHARAAIQEISSRGKLPMVVGGTGLYIRALLEGLSAQPGGSEEVRAKLDLEAERFGLRALYAKLQELDPDTAEKIKPTDQKRIVRALEIHELSGKKTSDWHQEKKSLRAFGFEPVVIGLTRPREELYAAIERRVDQMFEKGLVEEVRRLSEKTMSRTALQAVGYKELLETRGPDGQWTQEALDKSRERIKLNTRHLAKRQMTWFRKEQGLEWFEAAKSGLSMKFLESLEAFIRTKLAS